tara:strand:- start:87 stop:278 length:192 start_codon:yes stop_codon:yes gene_type:complete
MSLLSHYTEIAKHKSDDALAFAVADIKAAWAANPEFEAGVTEYSKRLWAEWDAYVVELQKRKI